MAIKTTCPHCEAPYILADTLEGQEIRCHACAKAFILNAQGNREDAGADRIRAGPARPVPQRVERAAESEDERGRDQDRGRDHDNEFDAAHPRDFKKIGVHGLVWIIIGSTAAVLLLSAALGVYLVHRLNQAPNFAQVGQILNQDPNRLAREVQEMQKGWANQVGAIKTVKIVRQENKDKPLSLTEHLQNLKTGDERAKIQAVTYFSRTDPNVPEREDVAKALDGLVDAPNMGLVRRAFTLWATKDQVPTLIRLLQNNQLAHTDILAALGRFKDEKVADAIAARLPTVDRRQAAGALRAIGPLSEKAVLPYINHADGRTSMEARTLLKEWNTKQEAILDQSLKDLAGTMDANRRRAVLGFLAQAEVDDNQRAKVGKAIEPLLDDPTIQGSAYPAFLRWAGKENVPTLIKLISQPGRFRNEAMAVGAKLRDENVAMAIAKTVDVPGGNRGYVGKVLKSMGPAAEKGAVHLLENKDAGIRIEACNILREIGTPASLESLAVTKFSDPKNKTLVKAASDAAGAIQSR